MESAFAMQREALFTEYTNVWGARPSWLRPFKRIDWELSALSIRRAIGSDSMLSPRFFMFRCNTCNRMLTNRNLIKRGSCRCGSRQYQSQTSTNLKELSMTLLRGD